MRRVCRQLQYLQYFFCVWGGETLYPTPWTSLHPNLQTPKLLKYSILIPEHINLFLCPESKQECVKKKMAIEYKILVFQTFC